jgi:hypothetical protein
MTRSVSWVRGTDGADALRFIFQAARDAGAPGLVEVLAAARVGARFAVRVDGLIDVFTAVLIEVLTEPHAILQGLCQTRRLLQQYAVARLRQGTQRGKLVCADARTGNMTRRTNAQPSHRRGSPGNAWQSPRIVTARRASPRVACCTSQTCLTPC